jgi:hypothetical protein
MTAKSEQQRQEQDDGKRRRNRLLDLGPKVLRLKGLGLDFGVDVEAKVMVLKVVW